MPTLDWIFLAVLAASIFHFGEITIPAAKAYLAEHGVPVRN